MRRILVLAVLALAAGSLAASTARAGQPAIDASYSNFGFYPTWDDYTYGPGVFCGLPGSPYGTNIRVDTEGQRETTFGASRDLVTGRLKITVSKVVWTGVFDGSRWEHGAVLESVDLNISGPGWAALGTDGLLHSTVLLGPTLVPVRGVDSSFHWYRQGHLFYLTGRTLVGPGLGDYGFEQQGGTSVDVCDLLGSWTAP